MITDSTFHQKGRYFIPNSNDLSARPSGVDNSKTSVAYFIDVYERELLISFLGIELYNELVTIYPDIESVGNEKWFKLVNGTDYIKDDIKYRFEGLKGYNGNSLISAFVFCKYLENDNSYYSTSGTVKLNSDNSSNFDPTQKYISAFSDFLDKYQDEQNESNYPFISRCGTYIDYYVINDNKSGLVSLETYLKHNESDFEGYNFNRYERLNSFGV